MAAELSADELEYHRQVTAQISEAEAVANSWLPFLFRKYGLTPGRDRIHPDGRIERWIPPIENTESKGD